MLNKVTLIGNLGQNPEIKTLSSGGKFASFSIATTEKWTNKLGERQTKTEWHRVVVFNENLANIMEKYVKKGSKLYIEGSLKTRKYTDSSGTEKQITEIVIQGYTGTMVMLDSMSERGGEYANGGYINQTSNDSSSVIEDDIPF